MRPDAPLASLPDGHHRFGAMSMLALDAGTHWAPPRTRSTSTRCLTTVTPSTLSRVSSGDADTLITTSAWASTTGTHYMLTFESLFLQLALHRCTLPGRQNTRRVEHSPRTSHIHGRHALVAPTEQWFCGVRILQNKKRFAT